MKFTDLFIRRPVLAMVVNLVILIAGLQSIRSLVVRQFPRSDMANVVVTHRLHRRERGSRARLHHRAARARDRRLGRHRLPRVVERAGHQHDHRASEAELRHERGADADPVEGRAGAQSASARGRGADHRPADDGLQFAAAYLGFASKDLDQNQITDYLVRVVQPKLSAIAGVQRADIFGDRTFAMRVWLEPEAHGRARHLAVGRPRRARRRTTTSPPSARTKGSMTSVNLVANTNLQTVEEFKQLVVKEQDGDVVRLGDIADVVLGAETYDSGSPLQRRDRGVHRHLRAADREHARRDEARARGDAGDPGAASRGHDGRASRTTRRSTSRLRSTKC